jgi:hypothetical protein
MHTSSISPPAAVVVGLFAAVAVLTVECGAWMVYGALTIPNFAPEIGPIGSFVAFSFLLAAYFAPLFLLVACPFLRLARPLSARRRWPACALAALLVAGSMWLLAEWLHNRPGDTRFIAALSLLPTGIGASVVLRGWNPSTSQSLISK